MESGGSMSMLGSPGLPGESVMAINQLARVYSVQNIWCIAIVALVKIDILASFARAGKRTTHSVTAP